VHHAPLIETLRGKEMACAKNRVMCMPRFSVSNSVGQVLAASNVRPRKRHWTSIVADSLAARAQRTNCGVHFAVRRTDLRQWSMPGELDRVLELIRRQPIFVKVLYSGSRYAGIGRLVVTALCISTGGGCSVLFPQQVHSCRRGVQHFVIDSSDLLGRSSMFSEEFVIRTSS
jgi:hypothetical protein